MPNRSRRSADDRAEARRRSRYANRGRDLDSETEDDEESASEAPAGEGSRGSLLSRLFPPAPPLPGRPDPLAGFTYAGPAPGVVGAFYLLLRNPLPWVIGGVLWATGQIFRSDTLVGLVALFASFAGLIGAGWFGWQRPWLFGLAAGIVGWLVLVAASLGLSAALPASSASVSPSASASATASPAASAEASTSASAAPTPAPSGTGASPDAATIAGFLITELVFQAGLGGFAGWYGGYLRRRTVATSGGAAANRNRRGR